MPNKKLIIEYPEEMETTTAVYLARQVVSMGRISKARGRRQFCFLSRFEVHGQAGVIIARERKSDDAAESLLIRWEGDDAE